MDSLIISLHANVNNSKFIKKNSPESLPATPPPLKRVLVKWISLKITFVINVKASTTNEKLQNPLLQCTRGQDYKRFSSMDWCSTHNLCSEMT